MIRHHIWYSDSIHGAIYVAYTISSTLSPTNTNKTYTIKGKAVFGDKNQSDPPRGGLR
jgi:hypothetical protein